MTTNLPALPVNNLIYVGTEENLDELIVSTDAGIYYTADTIDPQVWLPLSAGLPPCIVSELEYNPERDELIAATFGRGIWEKKLDCSYDTDTLFIDSNTTWASDTIYLNRPVKIGSEAKLTVYNCLLEINDRAKIMVDRGGVLQLENSVLTDACGKLWQGIEVWGDPHYSQDSVRHQGIVETDNVIIENARIAIATVRLDETGQEINGFHGGIINSKQTIFRNNKRAIEIWPYRNFEPENPQEEKDNESSFDLCSFTTTRELLDGSRQDYMAVMADVRGIPFRGCDFQNHYGGNIRSHPDKGIGIYSLHAQFTVTDYIAFSEDSLSMLATHTSFTNLNYGIYAMAISTQRAVNIEKCIFSKNTTGVYLSGISLAKVTQNTFNLVFDTLLSLPHIYSGLYLDYCDGYQVEDNIFQRSAFTTNFDNKPIGITINNSGEQDNEIYNNTFTNLYIGTLAQNRNRSVDGYSGLQIICNDYTSCDYDICVTAFESGDQSGIKENQGSQGTDPTSPANNTFSYKGTHTTSDYNIDEECNRIIYWHLQDTLTANTKPKYYSKPEVNPQFDPLNNYTYIKDECCPTRSSQIKYDSLNHINSILCYSTQKADSVLSILITLVDAGSTSALYSEVHTSVPEDALGLYEELIYASPYLSDSVMVGATEKETVLTPAMITDVLVANPQSGKSDTVQFTLDNRLDLLSESQRDAIDQGWFVLGAKELLESELSYYYSEKTLALNAIVRFFREDTLSASQSDSIINILSQQEDLRSQYLLSFEYFSKVDTTSSKYIITSIPSNYFLDDQEVIRYDDFSDYLDFLIQLIDTGKTILDVDSIQQVFLYDLVESSCGELSSYARNILIFTDSLQYQEPYILPDENLKTSKSRRVPQKVDNGQESISVFPVPAANYVVVDVSVIKTKGIIQLIDINGKTVRRMIATPYHKYLVMPIKDLVSGIYLCRLIIEEGKIYSRKVIISR